MADIHRVRAFWAQHPLWTGESQHAAGTTLFFEEHRRITIEDALGGQFDLRCMPPMPAAGQSMAVLDLGCGIGFWTAEFALRGVRGIVAADLTTQALDITRQRLAAIRAGVELRQENAEALSFGDASFDHVNCQGVVHHTPDTRQAIAEIARVLRPGGTASISVYHRNVVLKLWPALRWLGFVLAKLGGGLKGRGRERIFLERDAEQIVRLYDGADNPIGRCYSRAEFLDMLRPHFDVEQTYLHYFPARALPLPLPKGLRRWLDAHLGFMIYANVRKPCAA
jgi:SAM-dependent methyltransferase